MIAKKNFGLNFINFRSKQLINFKVELAAQWEQELFLIGCTAIEDRLQDNVSECIHDCLRAGKTPIYVLDFV